VVAGIDSELVNRYATASHDCLAPMREEEEEEEEVARGTRRLLARRFLHRSLFRFCCKFAQSTDQRRLFFLQDQWK
jgi:hypothetical protein